MLFRLSWGHEGLAAAQYTQQEDSVSDNVDKALYHLY